MADKVPIKTTCLEQDINLKARHRFLAIVRMMRYLRLHFTILNRKELGLFIDVLIAREDLRTLPVDLVRNDNFIVSDPRHVAIVQHLPIFISALLWVKDAQARKSFGLV